jgi:pyridoxal phosphate enzyme (YggS family)
MLTRRLRVGSAIEKNCTLSRAGHPHPLQTLRSRYHEDVPGFAERLAQIQDRIAAASTHAGRPPGNVRLMAVSKVHPAESMVEAAAAGVTLFGENRVQEFEAKHARLRELGLANLDVHLIGHLQSNKSAKAAELFAAIDSVDSLRLAERLNESAAKRARPLPILLEIKLSDEPTKAGLDPASPDLPALLERLPNLPHVALRGLMTIAPFDDNPESARACFRRLRTLREALAAQHPALDFSELSMGMSGDFEIAIEEGSTLVRIGTALFGQRPRPAQPQP